MIIWLAELRIERFPKPIRIGINIGGIVVLQNPWREGSLSGSVVLRRPIDRAINLPPDSLIPNTIASHIIDATRLLATEHEVTEALDEFLQRQIDLPYVCMEPEEIFDALPEWTRINTLDWQPEPSERRVTG